MFRSYRAQFRAQCALALFVVLVFQLVSPSMALSDDQVTPVKKDTPAPFTGLLVPEARFLKFQQAELDVDDLRGKLKIEERTSKMIEEVLEKRLTEATKPPPWYKTTEFHFWFGLVVGVAVTGAAVYAGVKIVEATR